MTKRLPRAMLCTNLFERARCAMTTLFTASMYYYGFYFMMGKGSVCCGQAGV